MENDRPPVLGVVGRTYGQIRLTVCENTQKATIQPQVETHSEQETTLYTDENSAYDQIDKTGRGHAAVCHSKKEWAHNLKEITSEFLRNLVMYTVKPT